jgi:hypothetical protein
MRMIGPWRRHTRWHEKVDAYVDGALEPRELHRFEAHLAGCTRCTETVGGHRALKQMAAALPQVPAPRSFRITPAMLAERQPAPTRAPTLAGRLAFATAGLALVALGGLVAADLSRDSDDAGQRQATAGDAAQPVTMSASEPAPTPEANAITGAATPTIPGATDDNVSGAGLDGQPTPTPPPSAYRSTPEPPQQDAAGLPEGKQATGTPGLAPAPAVTGAAGEDGDDDIVWRAAEAGLGTLVVAGIGTWLLLRGRGRKARG